MTRKHLIQGAVIFGTAQRQHAVAVTLIPPGPRTLEPHMTDELVGRFNAPTAQGIAPATALAIVGPPPVLMEILPPIRNRLGCFIGRGLHTPEPPEHGA